MSAITAKRTVGELVAERPGRSRVFEKYGIDFCCGGKKPLSEACEKKGVAVGNIIEELGRIDAQQDQEVNADYTAMPLDELADHIVEKHHGYLGTELPRLIGMSDRVAKVHGATDARLRQLAVIVRELAQELNGHLRKEEMILFPVIRALAQSPGLPFMPFGTIANPVRAMEHEHDGAGNALERMRELTDGYTPPPSACNTYRALLDGLNELEFDLHQHIHKENNILFPRAIAVEQSRR